ncbi:dihydrolipoamide acetyltransferase family protein [Pseudonocardia nantongensis]|uniref:dihydrolipoamide acetyltransferase family protein n=1 Tax=Pseudonocardia nantongensis TaxID=1181885 RepID=UPI0039794205
MPDVIMPKMGDAMEAGVLSTWLKQEGDRVEAGDALAEIDTDKATVELEAEDSGTLHRLVAREGDEIPVGDPVAVILAEGEEPPADEGASREEEPAPDQESDEAEHDAAEQNEAEQTADRRRESAEPEQETEPSAPTSDRSADGRVRASPITRRLAREHDIDLSAIDGSGPAGRVVERDVRAVLDEGEGAARRTRQEERPAGDTAPAAPAASDAPTAGELVQLSRAQRVVADRMQQSWQQAPHHYATVEVQVDELLALRGELNDALADDGVKLSINDFVMRACALALGRFPKLNSWWTEDGVQQHRTVDLAMAVALDDGLITPVIRDAAGKTLSALSAEAKDLAKRAREHDLRPDDYQNGTFTVSNMGMYGVESFTAIVNPPSVSIMAVSSVVRRPGFDADDNVVPQNVLKLTVGSDHRVINGAENAGYLAEVRRLLESPLLLTV